MSACPPRRLYHASKRPRVAQQARNLSFWGVLDEVRFLIHDCDSKFLAACDQVFRSEGVRVILTPYRTPQANAYAERFVRTVRTECLDWLLILRPSQLDRVLRVFVEHYNNERPAPGTRPMSASPASADAAAVPGSCGHAKGSTRWPCARVSPGRGMMDEGFGTVHPSRQPPRGLDPVGRHPRATVLTKPT
jgi:hypothetical protein